MLIVLGDQPCLERSLKMFREDLHEAWPDLKWVQQMSLVRNELIDKFRHDLQPTRPVPGDPM